MMRFYSNSIFGPTELLTDFGANSNKLKFQNFPFFKNKFEAKVILTTQLTRKKALVFMFLGYYI